MPLIVSRLNVSNAMADRVTAALDSRFPLLASGETVQHRYNRAVRSMLRDMIRRVEQETAAAQIVPPAETEFLDG